MNVIPILVDLSGGTSLCCNSFLEYGEKNKIKSEKTFEK